MLSTALLSVWYCKLTHPLIEHTVLAMKWRGVSCNMLLWACKGWCVAVVWVCSCLRSCASMWVFDCIKVLGGKCGLMTGHILVACHYKGTICRKGLSFNMPLVPNTTILTTRQSLPERLCYTHISFLFLFFTSLLVSFSSHFAPCCFIVSNYNSQ